MDPGRELVRAVAGTKTSSIRGTFFRHISWKHRDKALDGRSSGGRWGVARGFPVIYLSQPEESCVIEAYRWLVDTWMEGPPPRIQPRALVTARVEASNVVDLRTATARLALDLTPDVLHCPVGDRDAYDRCRSVAAAAHQLNRHGIVAPAAEGGGLTLALFADQLPRDERPERVGDFQRWDELPPDPRQPQTLRVVEDPPS